MKVIQDYKSEKTDFLQKITGCNSVLEIEITDKDLLSYFNMFPYLVTTVNAENTGIVILFPSKERME